MAKLSVKNVHKTYEENIEAVVDFNLDIKDKEFITLVGPSGCGKSTVLRMIAGLEEITKGELYINDELSNDTPPKDRDVAMVFQNYALYPHMNVFENMAFGLKLRKVPKNEINQRVEEAARILDISHLLKRKPRALSGGQRQRVSLGRAIVRNPKVFLLDEPLSNLDAKLRSQMRTEISKLHQKLGTTFIYVTHDQTEAMTMADRVVVMKEGYIQQIDTPQNLYLKPCNEFVAGFMGSPQINFIDATLCRKQGNLALDFGPNTIVIPPEKNPGNILQSYENKTVKFGIRPEHIHDDPECTGGMQSNSIEALVEVSELMGAETFLYLSVNDQPITARVSSDSKSVRGDRIKIAINASKIHIFDKETGKAIVN